MSWQCNFSPQKATVNPLENWLKKDDGNQGEIEQETGGVGMMMIF